VGEIIYSFPKDNSGQVKRLREQIDFRLIGTNLILIDCCFFITSESPSVLSSPTFLLSLKVMLSAVEWKS